MRPDPDYTAAAIEAVAAAVEAEHDVAGWLALVLCTVAARKGDAGAITQGRPGSWEAGHVDALIAGTVGYDGEFLAHYAEAGEGSGHG